MFQHLKMFLVIFNVMPWGEIWCGEIIMIAAHWTQDIPSNSALQCLSTGEIVNSLKKKNQQWAICGVPGRLCPMLDGMWDPS